jgi:NADH-quinone oxidoreductase subunit J
MAGLILLVAMIGAIVLTLRSRPGVRRQDVSAQVNRKASDVLKVEKITTGTGVS